MDTEQQVGRKPQQLRKQDEYNKLSVAAHFFEQLLVGTMSATARPVQAVTIS